MSVRGSRLLLGNWKQWSRSASRSAQRAAVASPDLEAEGPSNPDGIKPFSLVPGEKGLPIIGRLLYCIYINSIFRYPHTTLNARIMYYRSSYIYRHTIIRELT